MEKNDLHTAMNRAEAKYGPEWPRMSQKEQVDAIYSELRELDRKAVVQDRHSPPTGGEDETAGSLAKSS
jgi:hypothetical protein